jgi:hypothetical protein
MNTPCTYPLPTFLILFLVMHLLVTYGVISFCKEITVTHKWVTAFFFCNNRTYQLCNSYLVLSCTMEANIFSLHKVWIIAIFLKVRLSLYRLQLSVLQNVVICSYWYCNMLISWLNLLMMAVKKNWICWWWLLKCCPSGCCVQAIVTAGTW